MARRDIILKTLVNLTKEITVENIKRKDCIGYEASYISEITGYDRSNVSRELNHLVRAKEAVKILGRPVYFVHRETIEEMFGIKLSNTIVDSNSQLIELLTQGSKKEDNRFIDPFAKMIGGEGSLKSPIKYAKAAILYPPHGLHTLITGDTGVGKTTFAEMMYNYALMTGRIKKNGELIVFNCAEYADNPQLILSQLFGHMKGAFTGADTDKMGLVEKADGGILLLDEVHRLPPEGQEMLFVLMDKHKFRRLGETDNYRKANVIIIGATTEDVNSSFLATFLRRIPMVINLPSLSSRPITERMEFIMQFFNDEASNVNVPILVYTNVIEALLLYDCKGNIGQLKADIQLLCARGFLEYKTYNKEKIEIDTPLLPEHVYQGLFNVDRRRSEILNLMEFGSEDFYIFTDRGNEKIVSIDNYKISDNLYKEITEKYNAYVKLGYSLDEINKTISCEIERYLQDLLHIPETKKDIPGKEELFKIISPRVYNAVKIALTAAEKKVNKSFSEKICIGFALHISALIERLNEGNIISCPDINHIVLNNPEEFKVAKLMIKIIEEELEIDIPSEEVGFIIMFLTTITHETIHGNKIGCIILCHGDSTASSMSSVVNELLSTNHCKAIDMPLDSSVKDTLNKTIKMVNAIDEGKGVVLLSDMGTLTAFSEIITQKTKIHTHSVEMVSTPIALEIVRKCMLPEMTLEKLIDEVDNISPYIGRSLTTEMVNDQLITKDKVIITVCVTGKGSAAKIAQLIESNLSSIQENNIKLIPVNIDEFKKEIVKIGSHKKEIIAIVGTLNIKTELPFISIDEIVFGNGLEKLNKIIWETSEGLNTKVAYTKFDSSDKMYIELLCRFLNFMSPDKVYHLAKHTLENIISNLNIEIDKGVELGYIIHVSCMLERLLLGDVFQYESIDRLIEEKKELYNVIKQSMEPIEDIFGISLPNTEIGYIMDLINTQNNTLKNINTVGGIYHNGNKK